MTPLVSVCVPSYRAEPFLRATIRSVLDQTLDDWELILVDDGSPDRSWEIAQEFRLDPRVRLLRNERNLGATHTWNQAVALAQAPYVKLLCSDDLLYPTCLERQVQALEDHPASTLVAARRDIVDGKGRVVIAGRGLGRLRGEVDGDEAILELVRTGVNFFGEPSIVLFRNDVLAAVGGFSDRWQYTIDLAAYAAVLHKGTLFCIDETLAAFRVSSTSWSATLLSEQTKQARDFYRHLASESGLDPSSAAARWGRVRATSLSYLRIAAFTAASRLGRAAGLIENARRLPTLAPRNRVAARSAPPR